WVALVIQGASQTKSSIASRMVIALANSVVSVSSCFSTAAGSKASRHKPCLPSIRFRWVQQEFEKFFQLRHTSPNHLAGGPPNHPPEALDRLAWFKTQVTPVSCCNLSGNVAMLLLRSVLSRFLTRICCRGVTLAVWRRDWHAGK